MKNIITDYGAVPGTDCTAAFAAAVAFGGAIYVPTGSYTVTATTDACIIATNQIRLIGDGITASKIVVDASGAVDGVTFRPAVGANSFGWGMENIGVVPASPTSMRHALRIDLSSSATYLAQSLFHSIHLIAGSGADSALCLDNPTNTDGLFCGEISGKSLIYGGIKMLRLGDSFTIQGAQLTGPNVGFYASGVPGAAQVKLLDCNITNSGGAVFLQSMTQMQIVGNQMEQDSPYTGIFGAMVVLSGCADCNILDNNINAHGNTGCVIIENASRGNILGGNAIFGLNTAPLSHVQIGAACPGNALRSDNRYYDAATGVWGAPYLFIAPTSPLWVL